MKKKSNIEESYQEENAKLLAQAEEIASKLSINLRSFYEDQVQILAFLEFDHIEIDFCF